MIGPARQLTRWRDVERAQSRALARQVRAFEHQQRRIEGSAPMKGQIKPIAGRRQMRVGLIELGQSDETGTLPERARELEVRLWQAQVREISAQRFAVRGRRGR